MITYIVQKATANLRETMKHTLYDIGENVNALAKDMDLPPVAIGRSDEIDVLIDQCLAASQEIKLDHDANAKENIAIWHPLLKKYDLVMTTRILQGSSAPLEDNKDHAATLETVLWHEKSNQAIRIHSLVGGYEFYAESMDEYLSFVINGYKAILFLAIVSK